MNILGVDHLEFYVGDARQAAYYLCTAFGFRIRGLGGPETGLTGQYSLLLAQGDIRILLTSGLRADHPAASYVARHGDGIAVIAFATDGAAQAFADIVDRGGRPVAPPKVHGTGDERVITAAVEGFADVTHRLVERTASPEAFLPGAFDIIAADPEPGDALLREIDHVAICVPSGTLAATARRYQDVFGFAQIFEEYIDIGDQGMDSRVVQSPSGRVTFTVIEPDVKRRPGQIDDFLQWHAGSGVQHVAFATDDIVTAVRTFSGRGVGFLTTPSSYYNTLADRVGDTEIPVAALRELGVLVDQDHWGQMYQIFTQSMHVRRTLFLELIERHGALTFGSNNIRALYEAKERELAVSTDVGPAGPATS